MDVAHEGSALSEKALAVHTWRTNAAARAVHLQGTAAARWFETTVGGSGGPAPPRHSQFVCDDHWRLDDAIHEWMSDQHTTVAFTVPPSSSAGRPHSPQSGDRVLHELYESLQWEQSRGSREPSLGPAVRAALIEEGAARFDSATRPLRPEALQWPSPLPPPTSLGPSCPVTPSAHRLPPPSLPPAERTCGSFSAHTAPCVPSLWMLRWLLGLSFEEEQTLRESLCRLLSAWRDIARECAPLARPPLAHPWPHPWSTPGPTPGPPLAPQRRADTAILHATPHRTPAKHFSRTSPLGSAGAGRHARRWPPSCLPSTATAAALPPSAPPHLTLALQAGCTVRAARAPRPRAHPPHPRTLAPTLANALAPTLASATLHSVLLSVLLSRHRGAPPPPRRATTMVLRLPPARRHHSAGRGGGGPDAPPARLRGAATVAARRLRSAGGAPARVAPVELPPPRRRTALAAG